MCRSTGTSLILWYWYQYQSKSWYQCISTQHPLKCKTHCERMKQHGTHRNTSKTISSLINIKSATACNEIYGMKVLTIYDIVFMIYRVIKPKWGIPHTMETPTTLEARVKRGFTMWTIQCGLVVTSHCQLAANLFTVISPLQQKWGTLDTTAGQKGNGN